ncbi:hypothetical protein [Abyssisolibacter fermentans]|uniref:hypothetical protein n=1 Tax=Abyssisolibacter fermentans TaxID=1766203 RepID=UPI0008378FAD|nr:hypothetical protein [Abyssisolibacter fermentans]
MCKIELNYKELRCLKRIIVFTDHELEQCLKEGIKILDLSKELMLKDECDRQIHQHYKNVLKIYLTRKEELQEVKDLEVKIKMFIK